MSFSKPKPNIGINNIPGVKVNKEPIRVTPGQQRSQQLICPFGIDCKMCRLALEERETKTLECAINIIAIQLSKSALK